MWLTIAPLCSGRGLGYGTDFRDRYPYPTPFLNRTGRCCLAVCQRHYRTLLNPDVFRTRADNAVVGALFEHVRSPATDPRTHEDRGEQLGWNAHEVVRRGMVEVSIREQFLLLPHDLVDGFGDREQHGVTHFIRQFFRPGLDHFVTWVGFAIDRVTETHDLVLACQHGQGAGGGVLGRGELLDHFHRRFVGTAMHRAKQRTDGTSDAGGQIGEG